MRVVTSSATGNGQPHLSSGGRLVLPDGRELILHSATLTVDAGGGVARAVLEQRFANPHDEPLAVTYQLPLPADGAVAGFSFQVGQRRIDGEVDRREHARERYEEAILTGRTAAILEQERSSLFTQEIGNVPARGEVVATVIIDQKLRWLGEGAWEWRFPMVVAPRYLGAAGRVADPSRVSVDVLDGAASSRVALEVSIRDALTPGAEPSSPSHAICSRTAAESCQVRLAETGGAKLDRDLVVRWPVATGAIGARLEVARPASERLGGRSFGLLTLVPPASASRPLAVVRDLIVLIDASGSMSGRPLEQARRVAQELVRSLGENDTLELISFASAPDRFRARAERATEALRAAALEWLGKLQAGGATEMDEAVAAALSPLRPDSQRQVVLITDGQIGFEGEIVSRLLTRLPATSRLHAVGVGSAPNRSLTAGAARAGRGVEILVGLDEDGSLAAQRLLAHAAAPLVTRIEIAGSALRASAPERLCDLAAGAPVLISLELDPAGGEIEVRGTGFTRRIAVPAVEPGAGSPAVVALFARERVEDLEMRAAAGEATDAEIESLGLGFQIATRRTSWVAIDEEPSVDPRLPKRRVRVPQALPYGASVEGLGLRSTGLGPDSLAAFLGQSPGGQVFALSGKPTYSVDAATLLESLGHVRDMSSSRLESAGEKDAAVRPLRGRIVSTRGADLIIEFEVGPDALDWDPEGEARIFFGSPEGEGLAATVDLERSTRPGQVARGLVVRVELRLGEPPGSVPTHLELRTRRARLLVDLRS